MVSRALVCLLLPLLGAFAQEGPKVSYLVGSGHLVRGKQKIPLGVGLQCKVGDTLGMSKASRAELRYPDNTLVRLEEHSRLVLALRGKATPEPALQAGRIWANVRKVGSGGTGFGVRTPTAVAAVRGTVFAVGATDSTSRVRLYEGGVDVGSIRTDSLLRAKGEVSGPREVSLAEWVRLLQGEEVTFRKDGSWSRAKFDPKADLSDPWVKWNSLRDSAEGRPWDKDSSAAKPSSSDSAAAERDPFKE
ncbi:MAG TPA: FecR family protein [Fibrobacteria bacterium]|nr:FecR family protein [Fibrobacteria bacterium]HOX51823.1 FecR family protein [Fibrobacteria bacterium]